MFDLEGPSEATGSIPLHFTDDGTEAQTDIPVVIQPFINKTRTRPMSTNFHYSARSAIHMTPLKRVIFTQGY